jgi:hypothetical protein
LDGTLGGGDWGYLIPNGSCSIVEPTTTTTTTASIPDPITGDMYVCNDPHVSNSKKMIRITTNTPAPCTDTVVVATGQYVEFATGNSYQWTCTYTLTAGETDHGCQYVTSDETGGTLLPGDDISAIDNQPIIFSFCDPVHTGHTVSLFNHYY